nr:helix-turn-helix transcriptional regulator [Chitinophaga sp. SYP-B3965]
MIVEMQDEQVNRILPDTSVVMVFRFKGHVSFLENDVKNELPTATISGLRKSGKLVNYGQNSANLLVVFNEAGANAFIKAPLYELYDSSIALNNMYKDVADVEEQLAEAKNNIQRIVLIEQYLLTKLYPGEPDKIVLAALEKIHAAKGILKIKELAQSLYISQDAFEKRFRRVIGVSPKQFSNIIRMKSIVSSGFTKETLSEVAFNAGYFDQPHFNKDFKLFTGKTPTDFIKTPPLW